MSENIQEQIEDNNEIIEQKVDIESDINSKLELEQSEDEQNETAEEVLIDPVQDAITEEEQNQTTEPVEKESSKEQETQQENSSGETSEEVSDQQKFNYSTEKAEKGEFHLELENFQGPFDLLLHLIEDHEMDIYDVSISHITSAYLGFIRMAQERNLEVAGEFLVMAAALIELKSKMLLPPGDEASQEELLAEIEAEKVTLLERLVKYKMFKNLAASLNNKSKEFRKIFSREKINEQLITVTEDDREILLKEVSMPDLIKAFQRVWERALDRQDGKGIGEIFDDKFTVSEKMNYIVAQLKGRNSKFRFDDLFVGNYDRFEVIATFLAILELVKQRFIQLLQGETYGSIDIIGCAKIPAKLDEADEYLGQNIEEEN
jgi:segregation and condensation protein A